MDVYVFGNQDVPEDRRVLDLAKQLEGTTEDISFVFVKPNEDAPFADERYAVILDTVHGIREMTLIAEEDIDRLALSPRGLVHDVDLAFQLKYLKKIGRLGEVAIVGVPQEGEVDYSRIQSILRQLVAHDMQES